MSIEDSLQKKAESEYGEHYRSHLLDMYKLYVDMANKISNRRQAANSFFLTVNIAIVAVASYIQLGLEKGESTEFYWLVSFAGMTLCFVWHPTIRSYKVLNSGKFKVIHATEQHSPISPYDAEWKALGWGKIQSSICLLRKSR